MTFSFYFYQGFELLLALRHPSFCAPTPGGGVLPYIGHIGMCRCEGYGFHAVYSSIGYINQSVNLGLE